MNKDLDALESEVLHAVVLTPGEARELSLGRARTMLLKTEHRTLWLGRPIALVGDDRKLGLLLLYGYAVFEEPRPVLRMSEVIGLEPQTGVTVDRAHALLGEPPFLKYDIKHRVAYPLRRELLPGNSRPASGTTRGVHAIRFGFRPEGLPKGGQTSGGS